jgi:hypothetical protein
MCKDYKKYESLKVYNNYLLNLLIDILYYTI